MLGNAPKKKMKEFLSGFDMRWDAIFAQEFGSHTATSFESVDVSIVFTSTGAGEHASAIIVHQRLKSSLVGEPFVGRRMVAHLAHFLMV